MSDHTYPDDDDLAGGLAPDLNQPGDVLDDLRYAADLDLDLDLGLNLGLGLDESSDHISFEDIELEKIPRTLWEQTLAPLHRSQRGWIIRQIRDEKLQDIAWEIEAELDLAEIQRANQRFEARGKARRTGAPLPRPSAGHAVSRPTVQVNLRLREDDYARLTQAADAVGLRPTTLARALVLNGAAQVLRDGAT